MKNIFTIIALIYISIVVVTAQTSDSHYEKSLKETLIKVENQFGVTLQYSERLVENKIVPYADWRFRSDLETTLSGILGIFDYTYQKQDNGVIIIDAFRYSKRSVEEGQKHLEYLLTQYSDSSAWLQRKQELRQCMFEALRLSPLPLSPKHEPTITGKRIMNGYTIENIAIETLPGLYVCGSLYKPENMKGKVPVVLCPNGHFKDGRYRADEQLRCATLARMGAMAFSYDLFAWGESLLQFNFEDHKRSLAQTIQTLNGIRILDYLLSLKNADKSRVAITGGSGGGTQSLLLTALDDRIKVSVPVVMVSASFYGGCGCESGMPVHFCGDGTNNAELAAMAAPRPQLVISDGQDWTNRVPEIEFPYLKKVYGFFGKENKVQNVHLENEGHDYGLSKRLAMYQFMAKELVLDPDKVKNSAGEIDESTITIEPNEAMFVFGVQGELLPDEAIHGFEKLEQIINKSLN